MAETVHLGKQAVHRGRRLFWCESHGVRGVSSWLDRNGEETSDPDEARFAIVRLEERSWICVDLDDFDEALAN